MRIKKISQNPLFALAPAVSLDGLKDVINIPKPSFFPPAIGWQIVFISSVILTIILFFILYRYLKSPKRYALLLLKEIEEKDLDMRDLGVALSQLLKRVALFCFEKEKVASLSAQEWSLFLQNTAPDIFSRIETDFIAQSAWLPPKKDVAISKKTLYTHTRNWIFFVFKEHNSWKSKIF